MIDFLVWLINLSNNQKILLSRWLHSKLISSLKFLGNWKTMFYVISQEQNSIKTLEFTETNSYFYSFTYEKNIFTSSSYQVVDIFVNLLADRRAVDSTPKYSLLAGDSTQASVWRYKIFKLIFPKSESWPKTMYAEHWTKIPWTTGNVLRKFSYTFSIVILWGIYEHLLTWISCCVSNQK